MLRHGPVLFKVARVLMHRYQDDPVQNGKDSVMLLHSFLKLDVLIPKGMSEEIEADTCRTSLEESTKQCQLCILKMSRTGDGWEECKHECLSSGANKHFHLVFANVRLSSTQVRGA